MKTKLRMRLEIKEITAEGTFEGILSPYGNVDGGNDVVKAGAYAKTLKDQGLERPLLWQHRSDTPIGKLTLDDRTDGLWCKGSLLMALPEAQKAYLLIKARIVKGLSIGFESVKDSVEAGVRYLSEIKLYEGSIVTFPMNEAALITSVKKAGEAKGDFNEELTEIQLSDAGYQMRCALATALSSLFWSGLSKEEIVSATETVIQQFSDAYMAYVPAYVDLLTEFYGDLETWNKKRMEVKAGAKWSAADKQAMKSACEQIKGGHDLLLALFDEEADKSATTSTEAGATVTTEKKAAEPKPEPVEDHSALSELISQSKELYSWKSKSN